MNIIYKSNFGFHNYFGVWTNRIIWSAFLVLTIINFDKNPNGLSILIAILLIILTRIKTEQLTIRNHDIEFERRYFFGLIPITNNIQIDELKEIRIEGNRYLKTNIILNILPFGIKFKNRIIFILKNDRYKSFKTDIFLNELNHFRERYSKKIESISDQ